MAIVAAAAYVLAHGLLPETSTGVPGFGLSTPARQRFGLIVLAGVVLGAGAGLTTMALQRQGRRIGAALAHAIERAAPLSPLSVLVVLLAPEGWRTTPGASFLLLAAACGVTWWALRGRRAKPQASPRHEPTGRGNGRAAAAVVTAAILGYASLTTWGTVRQHRMLETRAFDLAIMENTLWNTCQGRPFESALEGGSHLGVHSSFILATLLPVYCAAPRPEVLLAAQAVLLALSAWPLFLIARHLLDDRRAAALLTLAYLVHPALAGASFYDFHELAFTPLLFLSSFYLLLTRRWVALAACVVLLLLVKEDMSILVFLLGVASLGRREWRPGVALMAAGVASYGLFQHLVIPHFAGGQRSFTWYYPDLVPPGEGPSGLLLSVLIAPVQALSHATTHPKLLYCAQLLVPLLCLPLLGARAMILASYGLAAALFASREPLYSLGFQYALLILPALAIGAAEGLATIRERRARLVTPLLIALAVSSAVAVSTFGPPSGNFRSGFRTVRFAASEDDARRWREVQSALSLIPDHGAVTASETLVPHVARRRRVQTIRYAEQRGWAYEYFFLLRSDVEAHAPALEIAAVATKLFDGEHVALYRLTHPVDTDAPLPGAGS